MHVMRIPFFILVAFCLLLTQGCINTKPVAQLGESFEKGTKNLEEGLAKAKQALENFDLTGNKELIRTNHALRAQIDDLTRRLLSLPGGDAVVVLPDRRIVFEVVTYTGSLRLVAYIDSPTNWFWRRRLHDTNVTLNLNYPGLLIDTTRASLNRQGGWAKALAAGIDENTELKITPKKVGRLYKEAVDNAFAEFLRIGALIPGPDDRHMEIQSSFLTTGEHVVVVQITPEKADRNGRWSFRGRIVSVSPDGHREKIKEFDVDSDQYPKHRTGTEIEPVHVFLKVK